MSQRVLGIDLGTLNSCVAVVEAGRAVVLAEDSNKTIPSCLWIQGDREVVGLLAKRQLMTDPQSTISAVKRLMGHNYESHQVRTARERMPYPILPSPMGGVLLKAGGRELTPTQVSARILAHVREVAERALGESISKAIISVPAHFNDVQRKATKTAAEYAGLEVLRLINEPTAAAFAYGYRVGGDFRLAVYDLGGGTFDITVMVASGDCFRVEATDGDSYLGGEDFDTATLEWLMERFREEYGHDLSSDESARLRLREAAEAAKIDLSEVEETRIELPFLTLLPDGTRPNFSAALSRELLTELGARLVQRTIDLCESCLKATGIQRIDIDEILLVGGQSRMPAVVDAVRHFFGQEPRRDINPDEVVAMGAALYGYSLQADGLREEAETAAEDAYSVALQGAQVARKLLEEVEKVEAGISHDPLLATRLELLLAEVETDTLDTGLEEIATPAGDALPGAVDELQEQLQDLRSQAGSAQAQRGQHSAKRGPSEREDQALDRAVECLSQHLGVAEQASDRAREQLDRAREHADARKVTLVDVTSHAVGIATTGQLFSVLIDKNVPIPAEKQRIFTTNQDDQSEVAIQVYQGSESRISRNQPLGSFVLEGIAASPRMEPRIEVTFVIDESGILSVRAQDVCSGAEQSIRVEDPLKLEQLSREEPQQAPGA